jgi:hypothetical protein
MKRNGIWVRQNNWWVSALLSFLWGGWSFFNDFNPSSIPYNTWHPFILKTFSYIQVYSYLLFIFLAILSPYWFYKVKTDRNWTAINKVLNHTRNKVFSHCNGEPKEHHQVTLFAFTTKLWKYGYIKQSTRNVFPWGSDNGWLVPVARTGHTGRNSGATFSVNDDSDYCEGICGQAWATLDIAEQLSLPRVTKDSSDKVIKSYAEKGYCSVTMVKDKIRRTPKVKAGKNPCILPRSIVAFPIIGDEDMSEAPKYILVFDSRNKDGIPSTIRDDYSVVNQLLGSLLGGI